MKNDVARLLHMPAQLTRRSWVLHCSALALGALAGPAAQAAKRSSARILVLGDSLSAEYGLPRGSGWVALMEQRLKQEGFDARVFNASISGETTAGGRARLPTLLTQHRPTHVVIELGANDALRGLPLSMTRKNLDEMATATRATGAKLVIVGMRLPPNYGQRYGEDFMAVFASVAKDHQGALVPFLLKNVADVAQPEAFFQADRIHPTVQAQPLMLDNVWPVLKPLLV